MPISDHQTAALVEIRRIMKAGTFGSRTFQGTAAWAACSPLGDYSTFNYKWYLDNIQIYRDTFGLYFPKETDI